MFSDDGEDASLPRLLPVYPLTHRLYVWDLIRVIGSALDLVTGVTDVLTPELRRQYDVLDTMTALRLAHRPDDYGQVGAAQRRFRFEEALVLQLVLARRRAAQRALGAVARRGGGGLLDALRRPAALRAHRGPARDRRAPRGGAGARPPDEPPPPGRGRLRQDPGRAARDAARRRLRRPGSAARADRGAGPAAPPLDQRHARRPRPGRHARRRRRRHVGGVAHGLDGQDCPRQGTAADGRRGRRGS